MFGDVERSESVGAQLAVCAQVHHRKMHAKSNETQCLPAETVCALMCGEQTATTTSVILVDAEYIDTALTFTQCSVLIGEGTMRARCGWLFWTHNVALSKIRAGPWEIDG